MPHNTPPLAGKSDFLTVEEVIALFPGRSRSSIYVERTRGEGIGTLAVKVGRRLYWRRSDIDAWFDAQLAGNGNR